MKIQIKKVLSVFFVFSLLLLMTSCGQKKAAKPYRYNPALKRTNIASVVAAQNDRFELSWNSDTCLVSLVDKENGKTYNNVPGALEDGEELGVSSDSVLKMFSPVTIDCVRSETYEIKTGYGADCISKGDFSVSMIENGIRVTYIFDDLKISVPVRYLLFADGLKIEIDPTKIAEDGNEYFLHSVAVAPFLCSTKNMTENSYLFYPSGSGALIDMDKERDVSVNYICEIYGRDRMSDIPTWCNETNTQDVKMPVFGSVQEDDGMFAIIASGAESGSLCVDAFNKNTGYSAVYPEFAIRGETSVSNRFLSSSVNSIKYSDYFSLEPISISYYPLSGEDASYNAMARIYQEYLAKGGMTAKKNDNLLSVKILGGAMVNDSVLGMPTRKMFATATLSDAQDIVSELTKKLGNCVNVDLVGYGKTGLEIGQLCGGFTVSGSLGGKKGLKNTFKNMTEDGNQVFFDMDPVSIAKSGNGFSTSNVAVTTTRQRFGENAYQLATGNKSKFLCYYLSRSLIPKAVEKSISTLKKFEVSGVALDAMASYSYSDYAEQKYYSKGKMGKDVSAFIKKYRQNKISVLTNAANIYAAAGSDLVLDVPLISSKMDFFSNEIPFYEMVLQGYIPMASPSLNLVDNSREIFLKAAESGIGLSYTVIKNFDGKLRDEFDCYHNACYDDLKGEITAQTASMEKLYQAVKNQKITGHTIIETDLHKTSFANGVQVYTNFGENEYETPMGTLAPYSFIFGKEATP